MNRQLLFATLLSLTTLGVPSLAIASDTAGNCAAYERQAKHHLDLVSQANRLHKACKEELIYQEKNCKLPTAEINKNHRLAESWDARAKSCYNNRKKEVSEDHESKEMSKKILEEQRRRCKYMNTGEGIVACREHVRTQLLNQNKLKKDNSQQVGKKNSDQLFKEMQELKDARDKAEKGEKYEKIDHEYRMAKKRAENLCHNLSHDEEASKCLDRIKNPTKIDIIKSEKESTQQNKITSVFNNLKVLLPQLDNAEDIQEMKTLKTNFGNALKAILSVCNSMEGAEVDNCKLQYTDFSRQNKVKSRRNAFYKRLLRKVRQQRQDK